MKVTWTEQAADDLESIANHIRKDSAETARRVAKKIFDIIMSLPALLLRGRKREGDAGRELVLAPWPYIAVYEVVETNLYIKAIRRTSRDWSH